MKRFFRKLHLWLSVPFGLIITIICLSGASLVFETEISELTNRGLYFVDKVGDEAIPAEELLAMVCAGLPDSVAATGVNISSDPRRAWQVTLSQPRGASVYVDQYTGEVKGRYKRGGFFTFMTRTHRWLLDSMKPGGGVFVGKLIVGISTIAFVFVLITGIIIWVPKTLKALKHRLKISTGKGWKRFWYDLHVTGGIYAVVFLLAMALTGLTWSFPWYRTGFYKVFGAATQQQSQGQQNQNPQSAGQGNQGQGGAQAHGGNAAQQDKNRQSEGKQSQEGGERGRLGGEEVLPESPFAHWQRVYDELAAQNPDFDRISVSAGTANVSYSRWGNRRASDRYTFDKSGGSITGASLYKDQDRQAKLRGWIHSVHVGSWGGLFSKILAFLAAFIGGTLPLTGYYLWIRRMINRRKVAKTLLAAGTPM